MSSNLYLTSPAWCFPQQDQLWNWLVKTPGREMNYTQIFADLNITAPAWCFHQPDRQWNWLVKTPGQGEIFFYAKIDLRKSACLALRNLREAKKQNHS